VVAVAVDVDATTGRLTKARISGCGKKLNGRGQPELRHIRGTPHFADSREDTRPHLATCSAMHEFHRCEASPRANY